MQQNKPDAREDIYFVLTSLAHVVATVLFGELLNLSQLPGFLLLGFAITSKAFALFAGENERFFTRMRWAAAPLGVASLFFLVFLPPVEIVLGVAVLLFYLNYPLLLRARERSPLDVFFHGTRYALLFWLGYGGALTQTAIVAASIVFLFGVAGELLVGLRSNAKWKTTASLLGVSSVVRLVNILTFVLILLGSYIFSTVVNFPLMVGAVSVPIPVVAGIAVAIFITRPVSRRSSWTAPVSVRRRELIVLCIVALIITAVPVVTRVQFSQTAPQSNYSVNVVMRLVVTGEHAWDGQWIIFNYQNPGNYYYVFMHTDGTLEISRDVNSTAQTHIVDVGTGLSPFEWHDYQITVVEGTAHISVDGHQYANVDVGDSGGQVLVSQSFPKPNLWVVSVSEFKVTAAS